MAIGESDLLHGCPGLSEWSGETVGERASLSADIRLYLHPNRVAKAQRVGGLEWEIPGKEEKKWMSSDEGTCIKILISTYNTISSFRSFTEKRLTWNDAQKSIKEHNSTTKQHCEDLLVI